MDIAEILTTLLLVICLLGALSQRLRTPSPIVFLLGGTALAFVPALQAFEIEPKSILTIFLPPLLMEAAFFTSVRDFKFNLRPILQLAIGLVLATAAAVAWVFRLMLPGASWAVGFTLGAIVSPPDAVAAAAIIHKMRVPKRIVTIIEGESLINDASGLILFQFAVAAVMTGHFSPSEAGVQFLWMIACGLSVGTLCGMALLKLMPRIKELSVEILVTFVAPYVAYLATEAVHGSGVLSVVACGLYVGWNAPAISTPQFRIPANAVWKMVSYVLNALVFMLIGLKIPSLFSHLSVYSTGALLGMSAVICATALAVRMAWVFTASYLSRLLFPGIRKREPSPGWQNLFIVGFTGMRGVVSLATALALPESISWGQPFPYRDLITFLALTLIVFTLVVQGLTLPWLLKKLTLTFDSRILHEDWNARMNATRRALARLEEIAQSGTMQGPALERIRGHYAARLESLGDGPNTPLFPSEAPSSTDHPLITQENQLWQEVLATEREVVVSLRKAYLIGDDVMHDMLRELDLFSARFMR